MERMEEWSWVSMDKEGWHFSEYTFFYIVLRLRTIVSFHILPPNKEIVKVKDVGDTNMKYKQ